MKAHPFNIVRKNKKECIYVGKYVTKRVLLAIVTVFIVCGITFFAMNAIPGGPFDGEKALSPEVKEALEKRFNLDKPVGEQFVLYEEPGSWRFRCFRKNRPRHQDNNF